MIDPEVPDVGSLAKATLCQMSAMTAVARSVTKLHTALFHILKDDKERAKICVQESEIAFAAYFNHIEEALRILRASLDDFDVD